MLTLLALDPGKTTGWSIWKYDHETPATCTMYGQVEGGVEGYYEMFYKFAADIIVAESFVLDGRTPNPDITPLRIEGVLYAQSRQFGIPVEMQRNNFKKHVSDELLKKHALWWKGKPHASDSARHALAWFKTHKHTPTLKEYFMLD